MKADVVGTTSIYCLISFPEDCRDQRAQAAWEICGAVRRLQAAVGPAGGRLFERLNKRVSPAAEYFVYGTAGAVYACGLAILF